MKSIVTALLLLVLAWLPAHAEVKEGDWSASPAGDAKVAPVAVDNTKAIRPSLNITQPELQVKTPRYLLKRNLLGTRKYDPEATTRKARPVTKTRKRKVRRRKATSRKKTRLIRKQRKQRRNRADTERAALEAWWRDTGNPAVFVFRDCLNYHAVRLRDLAGPVPADVQIAKAMDVSCRTEFDHMAKVIAARFGEDGFRRLSEELIETTFVPAASVSQ